MTAYSSPRTGERPLPLLPRSMASILDRVLVQTRATDLASIEALIDSDRSGVVVTGKPSATELNRFRHAFPTTPMLFDAADYEHHIATREFPFDRDDQALMSSLAWHLDMQRENGAPLAITPTRFIAVDDRDVLREVLSQTADLDRDDTLCLLPLHARWLRENTIKYVIEELTTHPIPVAIILGESMDPLGTRYAREGLRTLLDNVPRLSLFRTDLVAFEALSRGALTASIGVRSSLRHARPPGTNGGPTAANADPSPHLLVPQLLQWIKGRRFADDLVNGPEIFCDCRICEGESLKRFVDKDPNSKRIADQHAIASWMPMVHDLARITQFDDRVRWWQQKCEDAFVTGELWRQQFGLSAKPSPSIRYWAGRLSGHRFVQRISNRQPTAAATRTLEEQSSTCALRPHFGP